MGLRYENYRLGEVPFFFDETEMIPPNTELISNRQANGYFTVVLRRDLDKEIKNYQFDWWHKELEAQFDFETRNYYRSSFGFNPVTDRELIEPVDASPPEWRYREVISLSKDDIIRNNDVELHIQVIVTPQSVHDKIVFSNGSWERAITCFHTKVGNLKFFPLRKIIAKSADEESLQDANAQNFQITPEDHFLSLESFTTGLAEFGIGNAFREAALREGRMGNFFNPFFLHQVINALYDLVPRITMAFVEGLIFDLLREKTNYWFVSRLEFLDHILNLKTTVFQDEELFIQLAKLLESTEFNLMAVEKSWNRKILNLLALHEEKTVRETANQKLKSLDWER